MNSIDIKLSTEEYDRVVHAGPPEHGDLRVIAKWQLASPVADQMLCACITFTARIDGKDVRVQAVTTGKLLEMVGSAMAGFRLHGPPEQN